MIKKQESESVADFTQTGEGEKIKSRRLLKMIREEDSDLKFYSWDFRENYTYITYLKNFRNIFNSHEERKRAKVFTHISKLLNTRNPHQIKSHHQKMMMRHKSIEGIIDYLRLKIIKFLKNNPASIQDIEEINEYCEAFFIQESGFQNRVRTRLQKKRKLSNESEQNQASEKTPLNVKVQEEMGEYQYEEFKNSENLFKSIKSGVVKVEEGQEMIQVITN